MFDFKDPSSSLCTMKDDNTCITDHDVFVDNISQIQLPSIQENTFVYENLNEIYDKEYESNPSPLKPDSFKVWLSGYKEDKKYLLLDNIVNGIPVPSSVDCSNQDPIPENHQSAYVNEKSVDEMIDANVKKGWLAGPFKTKPPNLFISPLASIPKKETDARRVIHNLSYPYKNSVNSNIDSKYTSVQYEMIDSCIEIVT